MELPAKERLVGAAVLVTLIVLLVPELLSGPRPTSQAGPAKEEGDMRTYTIDLHAEGATSPGLPAPESEPETPVTLPDPTPEPAAASTPSAVSAPAQSQPVPAPGSEASSPRPAQTEPPPASRPEPKPQTRPESSPEPKPTAKPAAGDASWSVQLGSFSNSGNAERLVKELKGKGYKAFTSRTGAGAKTRYRVRVGPEPSRAKADALAARLKREGRQAAVVPHS